MSRGAVRTDSKPKIRYYFRTGEELPGAIGRILSEQLTQAVRVLYAPGDSLEQAVHEARRCIKRTRSILRLVRFAIPNTYARENARLRNVGRSLSELRDSHALLQTLNDLEKRGSEKQPDESRRGAFVNAHDLLKARETQITRQMKEGGLENSIAQLNAALIHIQKLSFVRVDLPGVSKSLYKSVKRGIKALGVAEDDPQNENFHDWRKRAKDLRYQLSLFAELRPDLQPYAESAKELEQILGDDHNLAVLTDFLGDRKSSKSEDLRPLQTEIADQQKILRDQAANIGGDLYGKKRKVWKHRLASVMES